MTTKRRAIVPEDLCRNRDAAVTSFARAVTASLLSAKESQSGGWRTPEQVARRAWPNDPDVAAVIKAASAPADTATPAWAAVFAHVQNLDIISLLTPASAAAKVLSRCLSFEWDGRYQLNVPVMSIALASTPWIAQGSAGPVWDYVTSAISITPRKILSTTLFSNEMASYSTPSFEKLVRAALSESLSVALDGTLFSANAGDAVKPPGLLNGISATNASASTIPSEAMTEDISRIIASVSTVAGGNEIVLVMAPRQAASMRVRTDVDYEVFASSALADGTIAAIATNALVSVGDSTPEFRASYEASFHMEDTSPLPLVSGGVTASPVRSPFQTDCLALRLRLSLSWALRDPRGVAWVQNVLW
jgi:hypothetical protein